MLGNLVDVGDGAQGAEVVDRAQSDSEARAVDAGAITTPRKKCSRCQLTGHNIRSCPQNVTNVQFQADYSTRVRSRLDEADLIRLRKHGGWRSDAVAQRYVDESLAYKKNTAEIIGEAIAPVGNDLAAGTIDYSALKDMDITIEGNDAENLHAWMRSERSGRLKAS